MSMTNDDNMKEVYELLDKYEIQDYPFHYELLEKKQIKDDFNEYGFATCPHTATVTFVYKNLHESIYNNNDWAIVATAHPAKFENIVEPIIGEKIPIPFASSKYETIKPDINDCINVIDNHWSK